MFWCPDLAGAADSSCWGWISLWPSNELRKSCAWNILFCAGFLKKSLSNSLTMSLPAMFIGTPQHNSVSFEAWCAPGLTPAELSRSTLGNSKNTTWCSWLCWIGAFFAYYDFRIHGSMLALVLTVNERLWENVRVITVANWTLHQWHCGIGGLEIWKKIRTLIGTVSTMQWSWKSKDYSGWGITHQPRLLKVKRAAGGVLHSPALIALDLEVQMQETEVMVSWPLLSLMLSFMGTWRIHCICSCYCVLVGFFWTTDCWRFFWFEGKCHCVAFALLR